MRLLTLLLLSITLAAGAQDYQTLFEKSKGTQTPDYAAIISFYKKLDKASPKLFLKEMGMSDSGFPLHLALFSNDAKFDPAKWHIQHKTVLLINNGIHPGEPDGIDACMSLIRDLVTGKKTLPDNIALAIIPVYNIGGCLNRSVNYRVDQNGPEAFGFRGNAQNLDLNRDFIKCDSKEARSFTQLFHLVDPDIFVDNHVSDGADYQHIMTLITSQHDKLGGQMGSYLNKTFEPALYQSMKSKGYDLVPYVNFFGETPDNGWPEFFDSPRYSSGYATLWNCFGFTTETHMLKPFDQRVKSTYALMQSFIDFATDNADSIQSLRRLTKQNVQTATSFPIRWKVDNAQYSDVIFKGYEAGRKTSEVSGLPRLFYDRNKSFEKKIKFYNTYTVTTSVQKPVAYIIPQGWWKVTDLLRLNKVTMRRLPKDTAIEVEVYQVTDYKTTARQYEMHHPNSDATVTTVKQKYSFRKGDYYIPMNQEANRFLTEVLEPQSNDSYFAWNFFDAILGQKEGYSDYMFEDKAAQFLKSHPGIKSKLDERRIQDTAFAKDGRAQLDFVFKNSPYFEPDYLRYPVFRVM